jgi:hypothetical protein
MWNPDPAGIAYYNIIFDVAGNQVAVPKPATLALFGLGPAGLGFARCRMAE